LNLLSNVKTLCSGFHAFQKKNEKKSYSKKFGSIFFRYGWSFPEAKTQNKKGCVEVKISNDTFLFTSDERLYDALLTCVSKKKQEKIDLHRREK